MSVAHGASAGDEIFRVRVTGQEKRNGDLIAHIYTFTEKEREKGRMVEGSLITYMNKLSLYLKIIFIGIIRNSLPYFTLNNISYDMPILSFCC